MNVGVVTAGGRTSRGDSSAWFERPENREPGRRDRRRPHVARRIVPHASNDRETVNVEGGRDRRPGSDAPMTDRDIASTDLRAGLIEGLRAARAAEREILAALDPTDRDRPADDGGWSPKDIQAHAVGLEASRRSIGSPPSARAVTSLPWPPTETDELNAIFHAERADWTWARVEADADASAADLIAEVEIAAADTLAEGRVAGSIMGNGPEHTLQHLPPLAARADKDNTSFSDLAATIGAIIDRGDWPSRPAAYARYNLACFYALRGDLDRARSLLRLALPEQEELRTFAPEDDDLIALRGEIPTLLGG